MTYIKQTLPTISIFVCFVGDKPGQKREKKRKREAKKQREVR
jgi:hypothetical protein